MTFIDLDNNMKQDVKMSKDVESLEKFRISAMDCFEKLGLPNKRMERWKYTDLLRKLSGYDIDIMQPPKGFSKDCHASIRNTSKAGFENLNIKIGIFGITYKPNVNDLRESPSLIIANYFLEKYQVNICEPNLNKFK